MENICPYLSVGDDHTPCIKHSCSQYIQIMGTDPQTGEQVSKWGCAAAFLPMLLIEGSQMSRQAGAAVESLRNKVVEMNEKTMNEKTMRLDFEPARRLG